MKRILAVVFSVFLLQACATPYQQLGLAGGYSETQLAPDVFRVSFRGNGATSVDRAQDFALLRAAELCLLHGFKYFAVAGAADQSSSQMHVVPGRTYTSGTVTSFGSTASYSGSTTSTAPQIYNIRKPGVGLIV